MAYSGTLAINVVANTGRFRSGLRGASRDVSMFTGTVNKSMRVLTPFSGLFGAGLGFGAAAGLIGMGKAANEFGGAMNRSLAIMQGIGPKMRKEMELTAHSIAFNTQFSAKEAAESYFFLASAGMDAASSLKALPVVSRFAQAGNFNLATATDLATDAQSAMGLKSQEVAKNIENLTRVTDVLVKANTIANASVQQFSEAITNKAGVAARMYGIEIEETLAVLAAFADQGIKGAEAGTKFGIVLRDLTTKAITNKQAFEKIGLATFEGGEVREFADILEDLETRFAGMNDETRKATLLQAGFTDKSVSGLQALIGYSAQIREWHAEMKQAGGITKEVSDKVLTDFDKAWNKVSASMSKASTEGFTPILGQLARMIDMGPKAAEGIDKVGEASSRWTKSGQAAGSMLEGLADHYAKMMLPVDILGDRLRQAYEAAEAGFTDKTWTPTPIKSKMRDWYETEILRVSKLVGEDVPRPTRTTFATMQADFNRLAFQVSKGPSAAVRTEAMDIDKLFPSLKPPKFAPPSMFGAEWKAELAAGEELEATRQKWFDAEKTRQQKYDVILAGRDEAALLKEQANRRAELNEQMAEGARVTEAMRTPLERYKAELIDIAKLHKVGAIGDVPAGRAGLAARKDFFESMRQQDRQEDQPTFAPALLKGSLEAYQAIIRAAAPSRMRDPAEETAKAAAKAAAAVPVVLQLMKAIERNQVTPGTVEVTP